MSTYWFDNATSWSPAVVAARCAAPTRVRALLRTLKLTTAPWDELFAERNRTISILSPLEFGVRDESDHPHLCRQGVNKNRKTVEKGR